MRYHNITKDDMLNGDGLRVVLWVSGCNHCCEDCQNPVTWDSNGGIPFDEAAKKELFEELEKSYVSGITLSGGDPLHPANRLDIRALVCEIREKYPEKTIWLLRRGRLCQQPSAAAGDTAAGSGGPCSPSALLKCQRPHTAYSVARYTDAGSSQPRPQSADKFCKQCPPLATLQPAKISHRIQRAEL